MSCYLAQTERNISLAVTFPTVAAARHWLHTNLHDSRHDQWEPVEVDPSPERGRRWD